MIKIKLGKKAIKGFAYTISNSRGNIVKKKGSKKGLKSLMGYS